VTPRRGRSPLGPRVTSVARITPSRRGRIIWIGVVFVAALAATAASGETTLGRTILTALQRFMLFYAGVFALIALTATVGIGLAATDRIIMVPSTRVVAQAVHRAVSMAALAFLVIHIVTEILAHRSHVIDAFIPFLARGRTFYIGLGTIASDLLVILIVTGLARSRFAGNRPRLWRIIHATAYLCWVFSLLHGLLGGRTAKPYVDWSYGACVAAVLLALTIRVVATVRDRRETVAQPVPTHMPSAVPAVMPAMAALGLQGGRGGLPGAGGLARGLTAAEPEADYAAGSYPGYPEPVPGRGGYPQEFSPGPPSLRAPQRGEPAAYPGEPAVYGADPATGTFYGPPSWTGQPPAQGQARPLRALPPGPSAAQAAGGWQVPGAPEPYQQAPYQQAPYQQAPYQQAPYGEPAYPAHPRSDPYPEYPYSGHPYADFGYPDDVYADDPAGPGPELWPDHPSAPMRIPRVISGRPAYPPPETEMP
jgi:hypothetical protein